MKKINKTKRLLKKLSESINYYYPFLSKKQKADLYEGFIYRSLAEAVANMPGVAPVQATPPVARVPQQQMNPQLQYDIDTYKGILANHVAELPRGMRSSLNQKMSLLNAYRSEWQGKTMVGPGAVAKYL